MKKKTKGVRTNREVQRLLAQSEAIRHLTKLPGTKEVSPKRYEKLLRQMDKVDRAIVKMTKILS